MFALQLPKPHLLDRREIGQIGVDRDAGQEIVCPEVPQVSLNGRCLAGKGWTLPCVSPMSAFGGVERTCAKSGGYGVAAFIGNFFMIQPMGDVSERTIP
jgi:hypothetical protein